MNLNKPNQTVIDWSTDRQLFSRKNDFEKIFQRRMDLEKENYHQENKYNL